MLSLTFCWVRQDGRPQWEVIVGRRFASAKLLYRLETCDRTCVRYVAKDTKSSFSVTETYTLLEIENAGRDFTSIDCVVDTKLGGVSISCISMIISVFISANAKILAHNVAEGLDNARRAV